MKGDDLGIWRSWSGDAVLQHKVCDAERQRDLVISYSYSVAQTNPLSLGYT